MPTPIKQFKDSSNVVHDLDNRSITLSATSGTLTADQLAVLQESSQNYIIYSNFRYVKTGETSKTMYYAYLEDISGTPSRDHYYYFAITKSSRAYSRVTRDIATEEWVNSKGYTTNTGTVTGVTLKGTSPITVDSESAITTSGTRTISHANSGATAGSYGDSSAQTPAYGGTFKVPYVTVNATGHVTGISEHTVKIPASDNTDTKNTAGSTDTSSKIFLVGATTQAANPQTYSDNQVYATNGQLDANKVRIAEAVTMVYDSTNKCINFNFA